jgi:nucleoside-diphosphate-sugar epimerase
LVIKVLEEINLKKCAIIGASSALALNFIKEYQNEFELHAFARNKPPFEFKGKFYQTNYQDISKYIEIIEECNYIFYCVGVTNAKDHEIKDINIKLFDHLFSLITSPKNVILISSAAILYNNGAYVESKLHAENYLKSSQHNYISLRPSVMHGPFDKNNIIKMQDFIRKLPFIPVIAPSYVIQPVFMIDILKVVANAIRKNKFTNKNYTVSGPGQIKLYEVFKLLKQKMHSKKILIPIPLKPVQLMVRFLGLFLPKDKIMAHQILNMKLHPPFDSSELIKDYDYRPTEFKISLFEY